MGTISIIVLIAVPLLSWLLIKIKNNKYKNKDIKKLMSGFEVARSIMDNYDLNNIYITESRESIISNYDPYRKVVRLKRGVFNDTSLTSCAISAKEAAHAILDKKKHKLFTIRKKINNFLLTLLLVGYLIIAFGSIFGHFQTIYVGVGLEYVVLLFHLFTLKIETDASKLAINELEKEKIVNKKELEIIKEILNANNYINLASIIYPIILFFKKVVEFGDSNK